MSKNPPEQYSNILIYQTEDGQTRIDVRLENETVWMSQAGMSELYQTTPQNITMHIGNIYEEGELDPVATCKEYLQVRQEGVREIQRNIKYYNLEVVLAVGYRVRSHRGTQFRRWATALLREYLVKGFVMDDQRLKEGRNLGADYFDELLERIRDIRASEKRFYQKIRDIYTLSIDYDPNAPQTKEFFQMVQNKLHWAITGKTAAQLIVERADATKLNMGLTAWKGVKVRKADVTIAKNYLNETEIRQLNRFVTMYLDYAETQAEQYQPLNMKDWREKLDAFLRFNGREVLDDPGKVSMEIARTLAEDEYEKFRLNRLYAEAEAGNEKDDGFEAARRKIEEKD